MGNTYIVKCEDVSWQRHSISIWIGNYRTKLQRMMGTWDMDRMVGGPVYPYDLSGAATTSSDSSLDLEYMGTGYHAGATQGIWIWDDTIYDRLTIWRPPYTIDVKRAALLVTSSIDSDASNYYKFKLLNSADDTEIAYIYTSATTVDGESANEMTVVSTANTVTRSQAIILQIEDELAKNPITGLTVVIDYEPSA